MLHKETIAFSWDVPEFEFLEKKNDWYWMLGIGAFIFIVVGIIMHNYLFSFLIFIAAFLMFQMSRHEPLLLPIEISDQGIYYHNEMFDYEKVFYFWIHRNEDTNESTLLLLLNRKLMPRVAVPMPQEINPMELRNYLLQFIEEQKIDEPLTNRVIKKIKF